MSLIAGLTLAITLPAASPQKQAPASRLTFAVQGMSCEGCASGLNQALRQIQGVKEARVSFKEARAFVVLDESVTPVSSLVAETHKVVQFRVSLLISVVDWEQETVRDKVVKVLRAVKGVAEVNPSEQGALLKFQPKAKVRYRDLVAALEKAGLKVAGDQKTS